MGVQECASAFDNHKPATSKKDKRLKDKRLKEQLKRFQDLPDDGLTDRKVASVLLGCSLSTVQRMEKSGRLEPAVKLGPSMARLRVGSIRKLLKGGAA